MTSCSIIGNVNVDLVVRDVSELPAPGTEQTVDAIEMRVGGAAANTALALARLDGTPRLVGSVGEDHFGRILVAELERGGVATADVHRAENESTGVSIAFEAPERDRSFLISLGSLATFDERRVPTAALSAPFLLLCGTFLHPMLRGEPNRRLLAAARAGGATTLLDTGWDPKGWPSGTRDEILGLLPLIDVITPNEAEAHALTSESDPRRAAAALQRASGGAVVVKLGAEGCVVLSAGGEVTSIAAPAVEVSDTTGAGDAFNAGLVFAMGKGDDVAEAARFAVRVASTVVSRSSANRYPTEAELPGA